MNKAALHSSSNSSSDSTLIHIYHLLFAGLCSQEEERLVRDLFRGYNKLIRPVQNMTEKVAVSFGLAFIQLINVVSRPTLNISGDLGISAEISLLL